MSNDKSARITERRLKTIRDKTARGLFVRKAPRSTKVVQAERKSKGLSTIDDVYGGVPNLYDFKNLTPLYQSTDGQYMVYFPTKGAHLTAWWRISSVKTPIPTAGSIMQLANIETGETRAIEVVGQPYGEWKKSSVSTRGCTGQMIVRIL